MPQVDPVIHYEGISKKVALQREIVGSLPRAFPIADKNWISYMNDELTSKVVKLGQYLIPEELTSVWSIFCEEELMYAPQPHAQSLRNIRDLARTYIANSPEGEEMDSFYMVDLGKLLLQMSRWRKHLPMVHPFYAMKCNPNPSVLRVLSALGAGFDCASEEEYRTILQHGLADTENIIFANPCKQVSQMRTARALGLKYVTFDNEDELRKLKKHWPEAQCVLRIATNDAQSVCQFSIKFGCPIHETSHLLQVAHELGLDVVGVSFHVGSGCGNALVHLETARVARDIFDTAAHDYGFNMYILDIGGGFLANENASVPFEDIARGLAPYLRQHFADARIIAEPGRYFAEPVQTLVMNVYSKRVLRTPPSVPVSDELGLPTADIVDFDEEVQYYVNDGVYHSFNCIIFDHAEPNVYPLIEDPESTNESSCRLSTGRTRRVTTMYGPTCDSMDCLFRRKAFPPLEVGDWLIVPDFGAYTTAAAASFNGFSTKRFIYMSSVPFVMADRR